MNGRVIKIQCLSQNTRTVNTFNEIEGSIFKNDENKHLLINCMELIAIQNLQIQEKKLKWSIYMQIVVDIESAVPKSH